MSQLLFTGSYTIPPLPVLPASSTRIPLSSHLGLRLAATLCSSVVHSQGIQNLYQRLATDHGMAGRNM